MASLNGIGINPKKFHKSQLKFYIILLPLVAFTLLPLIFIFFNAFKPMDELFIYPPRFITLHPTLKNFKNLLEATGKSNIPASRYLFNSIIIAITVVVLTIILTTITAYVLSKKHFKSKDLLIKINLFAIMFVPIAVAIPRYLVIVRLGLIDNFLGHIVPLLASALQVFLLKQFMDGLPDSYIEAAEIDGATDIYIIWKIVTPLVMPAIATVAIITFQVAWNSTEASTLYINNESLKNFAFYMGTLSSTTGNTVAGQGLSAASSLIMILPNLIIFIIMQSKVMNTMAHSGIK